MSGDTRLVVRHAQLVVSETCLKPCMHQYQVDCVSDADSTVCIRINCYVVIPFKLTGDTSANTKASAMANL